MIYANPKITSLYLFADNIQQIGIIRRYEPTHKRIILAQYNSHKIFESQENFD